MINNVGDSLETVAHGYIIWWYTVWKVVKYLLIFKHILIFYPLILVLGN